MAKSKIAVRHSIRSDDTFDSLMDEADLESSTSSDEERPEEGSADKPETPSKPLTLEEENKALRVQLEEMRSELAFWKSKVADEDEKENLGTPTKPTTSTTETGLWENTINGLRQFVTTPQPEKMQANQSISSVEFPSRNATGLHHRKAPSSYFEKWTISPFKLTQEQDSSEANTMSADGEEGVSLVKSHSSDREEESSIEEDLDVEPSFYHSLVDRGAWLVGLLVLQSFSSFIIQNNERLLQRHTVIVRFLTMLVGAGGNAGNQASVRVIRGLATGKVNDSNIKPYVLTELQAGFFLSIVLGIAGCIRAAVFFTPLAETIAITSSLVMIVAISILLGTALPLLMKTVGVDPAHSSTTIQVVMDIMGVAITVTVSSLILDRALGNVTN